MRSGEWHGINLFYSQKSLCLLLPGFFKGTSADQDRRFSDKEVKLLKTMKFPPEFDKKVSVLETTARILCSTPFFLIKRSICAK